MNTHNNARLTPRGREEMVRSRCGAGLSKAAAARRFNSIGHRITGRRAGRCSSQSAGWEYIHVAVDDHSRIARADIFPDQTKESATVFLFATVAYYKSLGIIVERVITDNGSCYCAKTFARACKQLGIKHITTRPYTPQTNEGRALHPDRASRMDLCNSL